MTKKIPYGSDNNLYAIVDDCDYDLASLNWCKSNGYAQGSNGLLMHRIILERIVSRKLEKGEYCDHVNGKRNDNRRVNIRLASNSQNQANRGVSKRSSTGYKGAYFDISAYKKGRKSCYKAMIRVQGKGISLGMHKTAIEAAKAYDKAAIAHFGEFALPNFTGSF